jgi:Predicted phosphoesterase
MILPVIYNIRGNLDVLEIVLETIDIDRIICCGDIVGYYTQLDECIEKLTNLKTISVAGNHDLARVTGDVNGFNPYAKEVMVWTTKIIKDKNVEFLRNLKSKIRIKIDNTNIVLVHGSPEDPISEYIFPYTPDSTLKSFLEPENADILIMGHTHMLLVRKFEDKLVFNHGSVGQPRDGDSRASFAFLDVFNMEAMIYRVK